MQTRGLAKWFSEQSRRTRARIRARKGRGVRSGPCLLCAALVLVLLGAMLGTRVTKSFTHSNADSADQYRQAEESRFFEANKEAHSQGRSVSKDLQSGVSRDTGLPAKVLAQQQGSQEEDAPIQGLWQHWPHTVNQTDSQPLSTGTIPYSQHAQQAGSNLQQQGSSSIGYASQDSQYAVADALTAGNSTATSAVPGQEDSLVSKVVGALTAGNSNSNSTATPEAPGQQASLVSKVADALTSGNSNSTATSAVPDQQDSLVSKVVGKLMPSALASKLSEDPEEADGPEGHQGAYYGGVLDEAGNQTMNDSTDSEPKATKVPNWTSLLNDNGTTPVVSELDPSNITSYSIQTLEAGALPEVGSGAAEAQSTSSSSSTPATVETLTTEEGSSQQGAQALPADPTQSQVNIMLSQAGLPANQPQDVGLTVGSDASQVEQTLSQPHSSLDLSTGSTQLQSQTESTQSQAGLSQPLGSLDQLAQGSLAQGGSGAAGLPDDWDWESYLQLNPDVAEAIGDDPDSAGEHWQEWGRFENRQYKASVGGRRALAGLTKAFQQPLQMQGADMKAMEGVSNGMLISSGSSGRATSNSRTRSSFGQQAAEGTRQSKTAA